MPKAAPTTPQREPLDQGPPRWTWLGTWRTLVRAAVTTAALAAVIAGPVAVATSGTASATTAPGAGVWAPRKAPLPTGVTTYKNVRIQGVSCPWQDPARRSAHTRSGAVSITQHPAPLREVAETLSGGARTATALTIPNPHWAGTPTTGGYPYLVADSCPTVELCGAVGRSSTSAGQYPEAETLTSGVFALRTATFSGLEGGAHLNAPTVGMATAASIRRSTSEKVADDWRGERQSG